MTEIGSLSVNINKASEDELIAVRGIGKSLAQRIIDQRPYGALHDLVNVSGINERKLASLMPYIKIESQPEKASPEKATILEEQVSSKEKPITLGETEAFLFLEDQKDLESAFLIVFGGFILGLIILLLRRRSR